MDRPSTNIPTDITYSKHDTEYLYDCLTLFTKLHSMSAHVHAITVTNFKKAKVTTLLTQTNDL